MPQSYRRPILLIALIVLVLVLAAGIIRHKLHAPRQAQLAPAPSHVPVASHPSTNTPASKPDEPHFLTSYMDLVRAEFPAIATTQPLAVPLDLGQAGRFIIKDRVYLDKVKSELWITRPDAPPTSQVLREAIEPKGEDSQTHLTRETVRFVHWLLSDSGVWTPYLICGKPDDPKKFEVVWPGGRHTLPTPRDFDWDRAFSWNQNLVVPSRTGISIFQLSPQITESYHDLIEASAHPSEASLAKPQALLDWRGLLAWIPWEGQQTGSRGAVRYLDGKWTALGPESGWPAKLLHLVPLLDGSIMQFVVRDEGSIGLEVAALDHAEVDEQVIAKLVAQLGDIDQDIRRNAYAQITRFGPGAWPVLEKLMNGQPPQAQLLIKSLLKDKTRPSLSGMTLLGAGSLQLVNRLSDGGVVFYADQGISMPGPDGEPSTIAPAWLSVRPGDYIRLLPPMLVLDVKPGQCHFDAIGDQWILTSDARGPRLFYGNGLATLLRPDERDFTRPMGMDARGRWLFRSPKSPGQTLIIDPHLPDITPRLPVWQLAIAETVGWDKDNWPAIKRSGAFALGASDWRPLGPDEKMYTKRDEIPPASQPTTMPAAQPPTRPATTQLAEEPILIAPDGTRYYGGLTDLRVVTPAGKQIIWQLPAIANGAGPVSLIRASNGKLFLFNQPGRVLRISPTESGPEPFKVDATFTHNIPSVEDPTRIWLDPAGRIDIAWGNRLAILFPDGYIPRAISDKMLDNTGLDVTP